MKGYVSEEQAVEGVGMKLFSHILCILGSLSAMSCSGSSGLATEAREDSEDLVRVQIEGGDEWFLQDVAIYGIDSSKKIHGARIVLRPTLVKKEGDLQPIIPESFSEAADEIREALPRWYLNQLEWRSDGSHTYCASDDLTTDAMIARWMTYYWEIENWKGDDIATYDDPEWNARHIANVIFEQLCE